MDDRRDVILRGLDLAACRGVEIGPLDKPLVRRKDGSVVYVDYRDAPSLKMKYRQTPTVRVARIEVDAVLGAKALPEALAGQPPFDYVVASHVIEHTPDLLGWMLQLRDILRPGGEVRLAVPDRRFTFDYLRRESSLAEVLAAFMDRAKRPTRQALLDHLLYVGRMDGVQAWLGQVSPKPNISVAEAIAHAEKEADAAEGAHLDIHCWVFTPHAFADLMAELALQGLLPFACAEFTDTRPFTHEFFVHARQCDDREANARSWRHMGSCAQTHAAMVRRVSAALAPPANSEPTHPLL